MSDTKITVSEKDKPFILALVASGITILNIAFAAVGALVGNKDMTTSSIEVMKYTFTLTSMSWGYYFSKKQ